MGRTKPYVLQRFQDYGAKLAAATITLGLVLVLSGTVTCGLMYNINVRRSGKPTGQALCLMLCCPCCPQPPPRKFAGMSSDDEEEAPAPASSRQPNFNTGMPNASSAMLP